MGAAEEGPEHTGTLEAGRIGSEPSPAACALRQALKRSLPLVPLFREDASQSCYHLAHTWCVVRIHQGR